MPLFIAPPCAVEPVAVADVVPVAPVALPPLIAPAPVLDDVVPVISTRCPTCFLRSDSCPSSMYDVPVAPLAFAPAAPDPLLPAPIVPELLVADPVPDTVEPDPVALEPAVPDVPAVALDPLVSAPVDPMRDEPPLEPIIAPARM